MTISKISRKEFRCRPKKMILQAALRHEFIYQQLISAFRAETKKFYQIWMIKLTKISNFRMQNTVFNYLELQR